MTALIVIGAIALFIFILLASSIRVDVEYDRVFRYRVKYLFFTFIKAPSSPKRARKKKKKKKDGQVKQQTDNKKASQAKQQADNKNDIQAKPQADNKKQTKSKKETPPEKPKMKFSLDLIKRIIGRASPHVKRLFKKIRLSNVVIDITAGGDDAAKAAISYGVHCSAVYGLVEFLDNVISFSADRISVRADFDLPKNEYFAKATIKLRLSTLLHSGIWGFFAVFSELRKDSGAPPEKNSPAENKAA